MHRKDKGLINQILDVSKINTTRIIKTLRGVIKKSIFYMCVNVPYELSVDLLNLTETNINRYITNKGKGIKDIIQMDVYIRYYDDLLDNHLAKIKPLPLNKIRSVIKHFQKISPEVKDIARLFSFEFDILGSNIDQKRLKKKILQIIDLRPSDYFLLIEKMIDKFKTNLSGETYRNTWKFYKDFQRLRDLLDDIMSIEEDEVKRDYNSIVIAKKNHIPYHFIEEVIYSKFLSLKSLIPKLKYHPNWSIFHETINFWEQEYQTLFKRLLVNYYINLEEFRESYFIIKQL